jgi:hypothetical protein
MPYFEFRLARSGIAKALVCLAALVVTGCGAKGLQRTQVAGKVTLDDKPLADGRIRFVPIGQTHGPAWGAVIKDGAYETAGQGVPAGTLLVQIEAHRTAAGFPAAREAAGGVDMGGPPQEQYLPARYNSQSELQITIEPGSGRVTQDFSLKSK